MVIRNILQLFVWKNLLFLKFHWLSVVVILSGCFTILTIYLGSTYQVFTLDRTVYEAKTADVLKGYIPANDDDYIYFAPNATFTRHLMKHVRVDLQLSPEKFKVFENTPEMIFALENNCKGSCFAVDFRKFPGRTNSEAISNNHSFEYALSSTSIRIQQEHRYVNDDEINGIKDDDDYIRSGFLTLQNEIDKNLIKTQIKETDIFEFKISSLPSIGIETMDSERISQFGSIFAILINVILLSTFLVPLIEEKQDGLKEFLVLATPFHFLNGIAFFLVRLLVYLLFLAAALVVAHEYRSLGNTPVAYIIILFALYLISSMAYTYLISIWFSSVFYAKVGGLLLLVIPFIFYLTDGNLSNLATFLFSTKCFLNGLDTFQIFTNKHRYFTLDDIFVNITVSSYNILSIYMILIWQCFFYILLFNYLSFVFPERGGPKKSYFFFMKRNFFAKKQSNQYTVNETDSPSDVAIIIQDLVKKFRTGTREIKIANRLNMEIKNKRITVLLGHNGVGKTTTLNMIMGCVPKDSGKIIVCSERNVTSYRHLIGYCPQHNVFMHYMTCQQHLEFFAQLRNMSHSEAQNLANQLLQQLNLLSKRKEYGKNLSGGMKRRLSLGIAISGETRVVILDEPSSGLDIQSRRELWNILLELRKTKAVLITTHHMEEAEILGDTICILANGRLERTGSPLELKRKTGSGYLLKLRIKDQSFNENKTLELIQRDSPTASVTNIVPPTVLINLPYSDRRNYGKILDSLEKKQNDLGIHSITVSDTSLEDVFLNYAAAIDQVDSPDACIDKCSIPYEPLKEVSITFPKQFFGIFYKKFVYIRNEIFYTLVMISLPFLSAGIAILLMCYISAGGNDNEISLNLKQIEKGFIYIKQSNNQSDYSRNITAILENLIRENNMNVEPLELSHQDDLVSELIRAQEKNLANFLQNAIGAVELMPAADGGAGLNFNLYFSGNIYHSSAILVNLVNNAILKVATNGNYQIDTIYVPIKRILTDVSPARLEYYAVILPIGLFFYMFFYVSLPFKENKTDFKNLQAMPRSTYWFSTISFDFCLHLFVCACLGIFQGLIMPQELYSINEIISITLSVVFYGLSYLPILYCLANAFRSISTLTTYLLFMFIVSAIVPLITSSNVQAMQHHHLTILFLSILPDFSLNHQLRIINENFLIRKRNSAAVSRESGHQMQQTLNSGYFFFNSLVVFFTATVFFIYCWENKKKRESLQKIFNCYLCQSPGECRRSDTQPICDDAELVRQEKSEVEYILKENREHEFPLVVDKLRKSYGQRMTVRDISFMVNKQECFGLLGVNGAGKTTTFEMLTGNCVLSGGSIKLSGVDISQDKNQYKYLFGYCPQSDCLNNFMTSYQILKYIAQLRGVKHSEIHSEVMYWLVELNLLKYRDALIQYYSGGTKRKLNAAIAMIGSPSVVFLDEPTTGVDPVSRRFLWKCIQDFQKHDKTIVLTSHSLDECEQLCNRLAIMADGQLKCIGYVPDIKQHYGTGFTISIKVKKTSDKHEDEKVHQITSHLKDMFSDITLRENHAGMLTYSVESRSQILWSCIFDKMEEVCLTPEIGRLIEDYSVNEAKLEDIFLTFEKANDRSSNTFS